jgi:hypothetical protein
MGRWPRERYPSEYNSYTEMKRRTKGEQRQLDGNFLTFDDFMDLVGPKPSPAHTLHREVIDGAYSPENVRWADKQEQANHRRNTRWLTYDGTKHPDWIGETHPLMTWSLRLGEPAGRLRRRLSDGWSDTEAIDGHREKQAKKRFSTMTQSELAAYKPWRTNHENAEARYLRERRPNEARLEFRLRKIGEFADYRWQKLYELLKEPDAANLTALRHSMQARDVLPRRSGVSDEEWYLAYDAWQTVEAQLVDARAELAEWSSAVGRSRDNSAMADREVLKRFRAQGISDDDVPDPSWLD